MGEGSEELKAEFFHRARLMNLDARTQTDAREPISQRLWRRYGADAPKYARRDSPRLCYG